MTATNTESEKIAAAAEAGGAFAKPSKRGLRVGSKSANRVHGRNSGMEKITEKNKPLAIAEPEQATPAENDGPADLMTPEDWSEMLADSLEADGPRTGAATAEASARSSPEDLWEKLSSTRWVKKRPDSESRHKSTVSA